MDIDEVIKILMYTPRVSIGYQEKYISLPESLVDEMIIALNRTSDFTTVELGELPK